MRYAASDNINNHINQHQTVDVSHQTLLLLAHTTVDYPAYWTEHPSFFLAVTAARDLQKRSLLI